MRIEVPRESDEFIEVVVDVDGVKTTSGVELSITGDRERPVVWQAAATRPGKVGFMLAGRAPGVYRVWARVSDSGDEHVRDAGTFRVD